MLCEKPVKQFIGIGADTHEVQRRCGICPACVLNARAVWSARIQLEASCHENNSFLTLTFDDGHLPDPPSLSKVHLQDFFKKFRTYLVRYYPVEVRFRYFACGEYGDKSKRPHYHVIFFGVECNSEIERLVQKAWSVDGVPLGFIKLDAFNANRASYVAKYTTKKLRGGSPEGLVPEFSLQSRRPGVGMKYVQRIVDALRRVPAFRNNLNKLAGSPILDLWRGYIRLDGHFYPVGRYMRDKISEAILGKPDRKSTDPQVMSDENVRMFFKALKRIAAARSDVVPSDLMELRRKRAGIRARRMLDKKGVL